MPARSTRRNSASAEGPRPPDEHFIFRKKTGDLFYDEDGNGGVKKVQIAELEPGLKLKAYHFDADFVA